MTGGCATLTRAEAPVLPAFDVLVPASPAELFPSEPVARRGAWFERVLCSGAMSSPHGLRQVAPMFRPPSATQADHFGRCPACRDAIRHPVL
jgi:hypothetical protein